MNKAILSLVRSSVIQQTDLPKLDGYLYFIKPRNADWSSEREDQVTYWISTIGNTFLSDEPRRPMGSSTWAGFKTHLLPSGVDAEWTDRLAAIPDWNIRQIDHIGGDMADLAASVWYA